MPIAAAANYIEKPQNVAVSFLGLDGTERSSGLNGYTNAPNAAQVRALAAAYGDFSNSFIVAYAGAGAKFEAPAAAIEINDEQFDNKTSSLWYFQNAQLDTKILRVYAPNAAYISAGVVVDMTNTVAQAVRDAQLAILNNGLLLPDDAALAWTFTGAFLDSATPAERSRVLIPAANVVEPTAGDPPGV